MIRFEGVVKRFGSRTVLSGLTLSVKKGEIVFVLGTSGTGKSVLLKNLVGLMRPDEGAIYIKDQKVSELSEEEYLPIRTMCGMVFQHPALFDSLSVYENIAFGLRRLKKMSEEKVSLRVTECLELVNLPGVEHRMPMDLSYGMQKRVSLARTVALEPEILLFDEPTTGLDPITTTAINKLIFDLSRKLMTTSLVVSHDMQCAIDIADRIIVLDRGQIVDQGTPAEMLKSEVPLVRDFMAEVKSNGGH